MKIEKQKIFYMEKPFVSSPMDEYTLFNKLAAAK